MTAMYVIKFSDQDAARLETAGGKGTSLSRMFAQGLPVPDGFHVTTEAYRRFASQNGLPQIIDTALAEVDPSRPSTMEQASQKIRKAFDRGPMPVDVTEAISTAYRDLMGEDQPVAVRSSATAEDQPDFSFAGQQESFLNVVGKDDLLEAVKQCWSSLWTARAIGYRYKNQVEPRSLAMAVVVQVMVDADASGILFTANPITGAQGEVYINAGWGLGEAVVGGAVTPDTIIVDKNSGDIIQREISEKNIMSVSVEKGTQEVTVPEELRLRSVLDDAAAGELVKLSVEIEKIYEQPMDIEWALVDNHITILQARPITSLPQPSAPLPGEWNPPEPDGQYMRTSIVDFMPNPLSPLFRTLGISSLNPALQNLIGWIGNSDADGLLENLFVTVNGYIYFRAHFSRKEWWWMLTRMLPNFPRMLREGIPYWREVTRPEYEHVTQKWALKPLDQYSPHELLTGVEEIQDAAYKLLGSLMAGTLGAAAGSEGLFTSIYNKFIKGEGDPDATTFVMGYDSTPIRAEKSLFDLAEWSSQYGSLKTHLLETSAQDLERELKEGGVPGVIAPERWQEFKDHFETHIDRFGHIIYDLDYVQPLPADDPSPMLNTLKMYLHGEGANPHERQKDLEERRIQAVRETRQRLGGLRLWAFNKSLSWAQRQSEVREDSIADIGLGYPQLRAMLLELGSRIAEAGGIQYPNQVFWLQQDELEDMVTALEQDQSIESKISSIEERVALWRAANQVTPPPMLPPKDKYLGFNADTWLSASEEDQVGKILKGVPASSGNVTGKARVLNDPQEFDLMQPGDILVAEITTPAWTPLFAMASAVVTDIGGPLSHGSIVAREYGIPAVLGTGVATKRIHSGQKITVDGSAGTVELMGEG